jgi:hypothetical protein
LVQTAFFAPKGLLGLLYWYVLYPLHGMIFANMIASIAHSAETRTVNLSSTTLVKTETKLT